MNSQEALQILDELIKPTPINDLQELVFQQSWQGKTYQQIAESINYDPDYIRKIGSELWQTLSKKINTKVSKTNFKTIIRQYGDKFIGEKNTKIKPINFNYKQQLKIPEGAVPLDSIFYVKRDLIEQQCYQEILKAGSLILIKAPSLFGKTSLKNRIIAYANQYNYHIVKINFEQTDLPLFNDSRQLLRWFCANIANQLNLTTNLDDYWDEDLGYKVSCTLYLENYILEQTKNPLIIALDNVDLLFEYPKISATFFPLLRFWYETAKDVEIWQKLRLIVVYSTDVYIPFNIHQSPFNVGVHFRLPEFTESQIETLAQLYELSSENQLKLTKNLINLVGGNPYLIRLAMYHLKTQTISFNQLWETAPTLSGIYRHHLLDLWTKLQNFPDLLAILNKIVTIDAGVVIEPVIAYKLESMGLIKLIGDLATPSCELYRIFFQKQLRN